tara:strand:+ start:2976 stop:6467 length:3492 start_codon:yes stop_codon:yes gene_type:complete
MASADKQRNRLIQLLKELFQLDQPDLDFGFYRIMHAKAGQVSEFLENDLLKIIQEAFGEVDEGRVAEAKIAYDAAIQQAKDFGAPDPEATEPVKKAKAALEAAKDSGSNEGDVYDHLYRFFERYYDGGDFMSRRYFARETAGKAAPYAVPYDGREVYLHWANRDQYYIKSSEYLSNFTFDPLQAPEFKAKHGQLFEGKPLKVHCRIVSATEGEHNNVKASEQTERYFIIHGAEPVRLEDSDAGDPELVIQFEYRADPEKAAQEKNVQETTWRKRRVDEASAIIKEALPVLEGGADYLTALLSPAPTDKEKDRKLLDKYLLQYTSRNSMDYFIHKDLGGFLKRELDFYIKNEVMRLDDLDAADAPRVESYLAKVKVLRRIARHLIEFLTQLEEFQKKLWLKKKLVTETHYCITLDRIPDGFYNEIAANDVQRDEWVRLFAIDELESYSAPLTVEFLKANDKLLLDTALFGGSFRDKLIAEIESVDEQTSGIMFHSDNFQAVKLARGKLETSIKSIYIDPPYNTDSSAIPYKNSYRHSSWGTMMQDRVGAASHLLKQDGAIFVSIDKTERTLLEHALDNVFGGENHIEELIWTQATANSQLPNYSTNHEYVEVYARDRKSVEADKAMFREPKPGFSEVMELVARLNPEYPSPSEISDALRELYKKHQEDYRKSVEASGEKWNDAAKRKDPWRGLYPYIHAEYRDAQGKYIEEIDAKTKQADIWVWSEIPTGAPASKQSSTTRDPAHHNYRYYKPIHPVTGKPCPHPQSGWKFPQTPDPDKPGRRSFQSLEADKRIAWGEDENKVARTKGFLHEVETNIGTSVFYEYNDGEAELNNMFAQTGLFLSPKSSKFVKKFIVQSTKRDSWFADFFAGSGSSAHGVIQANREDDGTRRYVSVEMGTYFDTLTKPRTLKATYASAWKGGKPTSKDATSSIIKYLRLESYEDALNNLALKGAGGGLQGDGEFNRDFMLHYWLDFETKGSPSLLNIEQFADPTAYKLKVKKPGTDEYVEKAVDLIETFNWLIGLHVEHLDRWRGYGAVFKREEDPELPEDSNTRLILDGRLNESDEGDWRFRKIEGYALRTPGDQSDRERVLVIWRKLSGDLEKDNLMLDEWFKKYRLSTQDTEFDVVYVNGSNNLPNLRQAEETWKVRLIEEAFHQAMWDVEG